MYKPETLLNEAKKHLDLASIHVDAMRIVIEDQMNKEDPDIEAIKKGIYTAISELTDAVGNLKRL